jgi:multiple sugar transport system permease protein
LLLAACLATSLPIALLYNIFLDRFVGGFTVGDIQ